MPAGAGATRRAGTQCFAWPQRRPGRLLGFLSACFCAWRAPPAAPALLLRTPACCWAAVWHEQEEERNLRKLLAKLKKQAEEVRQGWRSGGAGCGCAMGGCGWGGSEASTARASQELAGQP